MITSDTPRELSLYDYLQVLWNRRWTAITFFVICQVTIVLGTFLTTPLYQASTKVLIEGESTNVLRADETSSQGNNYDIFENYLETQMALIVSDSIAGKVAAEFGLNDAPRYRVRKGVAKIFNKKFSKDITLKRLPGTRMVSISVCNPDAQKAAALANGLASLYASDNLQRRALTFIRNQRMAELNTEFLRLQSKLDSLSNQFGPKHPEMIALREEIRAMAMRMEKERSSAENPGNKSDDEALLEAALLKIQENSVLSSSRMDNIVVVDRATVPTEVYSPKWPVNLALGFLIGICGSIFLVFTVNYMDSSVKSIEELKRYVADQYVLGTVFFEKKYDEGQKPSKDRDQLVAVKSESPSAEAYRLIQTAISWYIRKESAVKDIAVLSPGPGEGKTTVVSNLAIAFSQIGVRVLVVDSDIRRGRFHEIFELSNDKGLGHYLTEDMPIEGVIQKSGLKNLSVVTCGSSSINPSQLFNSPRMERFAAAARERFDLVIYDTAPLTIISDTLAVVSCLSSVLMIVRSGVTSTVVLPKALSMIKGLNAKFIGVIFNSTYSSDNPYYNKYYKRQ